MSEHISFFHKIDLPNILGKIDLSKVNNEIKERCCYCGILLHSKLITNDHLIPKARGGVNAKSNLKFCCSLCNLAKGSKYPEEFLYLFILKYRKRNGDKHTKYRHINSYKNMIKNTMQVISYVRNKGSALFDSEDNYELYKDIRRQYNPFITYLTKYKKQLK